MSYTIKKNDPVVNVKLTAQGRRNLAAGKLTFSNFTLGDSEMDYSSDDKSGINILRPSENQIGLTYPVGKSNQLDISNPITVVNSIPNEVYATAKERGFFDYSGTTSPSEVLCSLHNITSTTNGDSKEISFDYTSGTTKNVDYIDLKPGDFIFVKYESDDYISGSTPYTQTSEITSSATQYLWYVVDKIGTADNGDNQSLTGMTIGSVIDITLDRKLPKGVANITAFIYPGKDTIKDYYDEENPVAYWQGGLLDFSNNNTQSDLDVPVWNMNIIHIEDVIGLESIDDKSKYDTVSNSYLGAAINFNKYDTNSKIGLIHYTNNTVSNFYGEGFKQSTMKLKIPYLMWHKKQYSGTTFNEIGYTFITDTELKSMSTSEGVGTTFQYYDLIDQEVNKNVVGKVLIDEKVIIIEDPELLTVLSYKSNRNWTLPKPKLTLTEPGICGNTSTLGVLQPGEFLYVSYLLDDTEGITGMHCEDYTTISNNTDSPKDVMFEFNKINSEPNYNEFSYLTDYDDISGLGFKTNQVLLLWQKSESQIKPDPGNWTYTDVSTYLGTNGCVTGVMNVDGTNFELHADILDYATDSIPTHSVINTTLFDVFELGNVPVGEIIVIYNGVVQKEASDDTLSDGIYYHHPEGYATGPNGKSVIVFNQGYGTNNDLLQIYYLIGKSNTAKTVKEVITVPALSVIDSNTNSDSIYKSSTPPNRVSLKLNKQPNNSTVWLFYKGVLLSSSTYGVFVNNETIDDRRVELNFVPAQGSEITMFYLDNSGLGQTVNSNILTKDTISALRVNIDQNILDNSELDIYNLSDYIEIPKVNEPNKHTFGDEVIFYGNIETDIKATIYKTQLTCNVLPNQYISTTNPTFNSDQDKVAFTEIAIKDNSDEIVAIGKFSEPITRKYNSDMLVLQVTIDF